MKKKLPWCAWVEHTTLLLCLGLRGLPGCETLGFKTRKARGKQRRAGHCILQRYGKSRLEQIGNRNPWETALEERPSTYMFGRQCDHVGEDQEIIRHQTNKDVCNEWARDSNSADADPRGGRLLSSWGIALVLEVRRVCTDQPTTNQHPVI